MEEQERLLEDEDYGAENDLLMLERLMEEELEKKWSDEIKEIRLTLVTFMPHSFVPIFLTFGVNFLSLKNVLKCDPFLIGVQKVTLLVGILEIYKY